MKSTILFCCLCGLYLSGMAQSAVTAQTSGTATSYNVYDMTGKPYRNSEFADVTGTPFFDTLWRPAELDMGGGKKMLNVMVKINAYSNEVHFLSVNSVEFTTPSGLIKRIKFSDSTRQPPVVTLYQCDFPAIDNQKEMSFYQVISSGKLELLKSVEKRLEESKNELTGERSRQFETFENFYVFQNGAMKRLKKDKSSVLELMTDQKEKMDAFVAAQKINFKNAESLKKVFDYYNSTGN